MASGYSSLKIELIGTGEQAGTWGTVTNTNLGTALEEAIVGRATANFPTDADLTITLTNSNASQVARNYVLNVTSSGSLTTTRNLIVPTIEKPYIIENNTTGAQSIIVKTVAGTGITVPNGKRMMVYTDGTNVVSALTNLPADITVGGAVISGPSTTETLTNKTISADSNTLSGIAASSFVLSNASGNIDGTAVQKVIPAGTVVGTTDTQTLTNKTLTTPVISTISNTGTVTLPTATDTLVGRATTDTLTNKTISADNNTLSGIAASSFVLSNASGNIDGAAVQKVIPTGDVIGTTDTQTLTNKTISADSNTLSGIAALSFVLSNASGNIDGAAVQKAIPAGVVVGTTDTQTLTNKTISADSNTLSGIAASSFVLSNNLGNIDGAAVQKAIPTGDVIGTTDTQTLTNKTISADSNTLSGIAASSFVLSNASGNIDGAAVQKAIPAGVVVGTTDTQTLTNKNISARVVAAGTTTGTISPTSDTSDVFTMLGLTGAVTVGAPTGTPTNGQKLVLRIRDNGTARALTWTTTSGGYRVIGSTLPTTTAISKLIYVGCIYNSTDVFWDVVAVTAQA